MVQIHETNVGATANISFFGGEPSNYIVSSILDRVFGAAATFTIVESDVSKLLAHILNSLIILHASPALKEGAVWNVIVLIVMTDDSLLGNHVSISTCQVSH